MFDLHDPELSRRVQHALDFKTKPVGALGRLEALAMQLSPVLGSTSPRLLGPQLVVFAAEHGIAVQGVSAYPSEVTAQPHARAGVSSWTASSARLRWRRLA